MGWTPYFNVKNNLFSTNRAISSGTSPATQASASQGNHYSLLLQEVGVFRRVGLRANPAYGRRRDLSYENQKRKKLFVSLFSSRRPGGDGGVRSLNGDMQVELKQSLTDQDGLRSGVRARSPGSCKRQSERLRPSLFPGLRRSLRRKGPLLFSG